jgi:urea transport system permease protein
MNATLSRRAPLGAPAAAAGDLPQAHAPGARAGELGGSLGAVGSLGSAHLLAALLILVPLALVPFGFRAYTANALALFLIYGLLAMSLSLIWGFAGIMSFGQTAFFGVGAYAYGIIGLNLIGTAGDTGLAVLGGLGAATLLAAFVGYFIFYGRVSDVYAAIITLALTLILYTFAVSTAGDEWVIGVARLGGFNGLFGQGGSAGNIANFQIPPVTLHLPGMGAPIEFKINRETASGYYLVLGACIVTFAAAQLLLGTRLGRVCAAIRENEARTANLGYDTRLYKLAVFTAAGAIAGLAGVLFAAWGRFVNPDRFGLAFASSVVVYVLLGGRSMLLGAFVGALIVNYLTSYLAEVAPFSGVAGQGSALVDFVMEATRRVLIQAPVLMQGAVLLAMVLLLRDGVTPPLFRALRRHQLVGWLVLLPAVLLYSGHQVACRQADLCLF